MNPLVMTPTMNRPSRVPKRLPRPPVRAVAKGALAGIPVMLVFLSIAVWLITDQSAVDSIVIALLPGVLLGVFGGGFLGVLRGMDH